MKKGSKDIMLKEMDFWYECGDVIGQWLNDDEYVVWLHDDHFEGRDQLLKELEADPQTVEMEIYIIIKKKDNDYQISLSVLCKDENNKALGSEKDYFLSPQDNEYMVKCLSESEIIDAMEYELKEQGYYQADNEYIGR